jgi:hypothetical protein
MPYTTYTDPVKGAIDEMNAVSDRYFEKTLNQLVYQDDPILNRLKSKNKVKIKGGSEIEWRVRAEKLGSVQSVDPESAVTWDHKQTRIPVSIKWKFYFGSTSANWPEIAANKGKAQIVDLVKDKTEELMQDINDKLIADMYAATAADEMDITPLGDMIGATTYAGLNPATLTDATRWQSILDVRGAAAPLGLYTDGTNTSLAAMINAATFGRERPTIIVVDEDLFTAIESALDPRHRISDEEMVKIGFDNIKFKNIPIISSKFIPAGTVYGLNENALEMDVHTDYDFKTTKWKEHEDYPNALFKGISLQANLRLKERHTSFKMTNVEGCQLDVT